MGVNRPAPGTDPTGVPRKSVMREAAPAVGYWQHVELDRQRERVEIAGEAEVQRALGKQWGAVRSVLATLAIMVVLLTIALLYWALVIR